MSPKQTCLNCGYQWETGTDGSHYCIQILSKNNILLRDALVSIIGTDIPEQLDRMESFLMKSDQCESEKLIMKKAIDTLRQTRQ